MSGCLPIRWSAMIPAVPSKKAILHSQQTLLDFVDYVCHSLPMKEQSRIVVALKGQFDQDYKALKEIQREQDQLRPSYNRFCELTEQSKERIDRVRRLLVMLWMRDPTASFKQSLYAKATELGIALPEGWETVTVWEAVLEIVRQFPNTQIVDLLQWLEKDLGIEASRQSVDSALAAHDDLFHVQRVGKGKYVSLRKEQDAASTKSKRK
jgi:hypothetical protein